MKLNEVRIKPRLLAAFAICIAFLMVVAAVSLAAFAQFNNTVEQVVEKETTLLDAALHALVASAGGRTAEQAAEYVAALKAAHRYQRDVY